MQRRYSQLKSKLIQFSPIFFLLLEKKENLHAHESTIFVTEDKRVGFITSYLRNNAKTGTFRRIYRDINFSYTLSPATIIYVRLS